VREPLTLAVALVPWSYLHRIPIGHPQWTKGQHHGQNNIHQHTHRITRPSPSSSL